MGGRSSVACAAAVLAAAVGGCGSSDERTARDAPPPVVAPASTWHALNVALGLELGGDTEGARRVLGVAATLQPDDPRLVVRYALSWLPDDPDTTFELVEEALMMRPDRMSKAAVSALRASREILHGGTPLDEAISLVRDGPLALGPGEGLSVIALLENLHPGAPALAELRSAAREAAEREHSRAMASRGI